VVKYLIIRLSSIGDIVLTTPVLRCLKNQVEGAEIHFLVKKKYETLLKNNPYIDKIHIFDGSISDTIRSLKQEDFHYIIDLHKNIRTYIIKNRLPFIPFSFDKLFFKKLLYVHLGINKLPKAHVVDRYMETLWLFDVTNDQKGLDFFIPREDEVDISKFPEHFRNGYILFSIGGLHYTKRLPADKTAKICKLTQLPVIIAGGEENSDEAEQIKELSGNLVINACGKFNINESASLIRQAKVVITHDTGLMHIAAAFKKNVVSIWGNTVPDFGMTPYYPGSYSKIFEVENLKCRPCSKIGYQKCPKKHFKCMLEQNEKEIAEYAKYLFNLENN